MIPDRIAAHIRQQNWTAIAIEFVIVVLGVYVGLQVNLWNEARVEATRRQQIIDALDQSCAGSSSSARRVARNCAPIAPSTTR